MPQELASIPRQAETLVATAKELFGPDLVGVYLHGSIVSGGLRPQSDLDLLVVVSTPVPEATRRELLARLLSLSGRYPRSPEDPRCLEVLVLLATQLAAPDYPAHCEFMYGEWLRRDFEQGEMPSPFAGPVITLLLAQARSEACALCGPPLPEILSDISQADVRRAMQDSLPALLNDLTGDERNVLLTLTRMWRTAAIGDFVAKDVAAEWAALRLPADLAELVMEAARAYRGEVRDDWRQRQAAARETADHLSREVLDALADR